MRWPHAVREGGDLPLRSALPHAETAGPYSTINFAAQPQVIGKHSYFSGRRFNGLFDEPAVWNQVLSEREIAKLFGLGKSGQAITP